MRGAALALLALPAAAFAGQGRQMSVELKVKVSLDAPARSLKLWVPVPSTQAHQRVEDLEFDVPFAASLKKDPEYGNRYVFASAQGLDAGERTLKLAYKVTRFDAAGGADTGAELLERFLKPDRLVPLGGPVAREAKLALKGAPGKPAARALYDRVAETLVYDKTKPGWGNGDALRACDVRAGNCTDFHSLFIGMARARKIPARFVMGYSVPLEQSGPLKGYHCWAEFWDAEKKVWVPVDASEASKHPEKKEAFFGGLDADRFEISRGRDILLEPAPSLGRLNYFNVPIAEADGRPLKDLHWEISVN